MDNRVARKRVKEIRESLGWTRKDLAEKLNVTEQIVANLELGRKQIYADDLFDIVKVFGMTLDQFYGSEIKLNRELSIDESKLIDIYQSISKRSKDFLIEFAENLKKYESKEVVTIMPMIDEGRIKTRQMDYYDMAAGMGSGQVIETSIPKKIEVALNNIPENADFIIRVYGDSMEPTFHSDDRLFIQRVESLSIGDIGVFSYQGEELVKEMGNGYLISHNKAYKPIFINGDDLFIQGKVVGKV